jgi:EAL domain-containing protein (putative c-di-GMP-specific phosphodiesterase class I)
MITKTFAAFWNKDYEFAINLTVDDILDSNMRAFISMKLKDFPNPGNVIFEIVETEGIQNFVEVKAFIDDIKKYGAKIAIDDFGTGYSNLLYLTKLNIDILKIDGSIIKKIGHDQSSWFVAKTILYLTKGMNIKTVAEFVDSQQVYDEVKNLEMDYSQGYFFSKPISCDELFPNN